jgi:hypothetical protein
MKEEVFAYNMGEKNDAVNGVNQVFFSTGAVRSSKGGLLRAAFENLKWYWDMRVYRGIRAPIRERTGVSISFSDSDA